MLKVHNKKVVLKVSFKFLFLRNYQMKQAKNLVRDYFRNPGNTVMLHSAAKHIKGSTISAIAATTENPVNVYCDVE